MFRVWGDEKKKKKNCKEPDEIGYDVPKFQLNDQQTVFVYTAGSSHEKILCTLVSIKNCKQRRPSYLLFTLFSYTRTHARTTMMMPLVIQDSQRTKK